MTTFSSVLVWDGRDLIQVAAKWGLVIMFIAYWEVDINNWKETDSSALGLKESDERIFSWTGILTATYFKSHHCNKKVMIFGIMLQISWILYRKDLDVFPAFLFYFYWTVGFQERTVMYFELCTDFALPRTPCKVNIIICPCLCKF